MRWFRWWEFKFAASTAVFAWTQACTLRFQNEKKLVPADVKVEFINRLAQTGLRSIEATSFVSAKWVPQMGDNSEVMSKIARKPGVSYPVLTPNLKGFESALEAGAKEVAIFAAASDSFSMKNINCKVIDSFERFRPVVEAAKAADVRVRGYVAGLGSPSACCFPGVTLCPLRPAATCHAFWAAPTRVTSSPTPLALWRSP